jgi:hypothetical protein
MFLSIYMAELFRLLPLSFLTYYTTIQAKEDGNRY